MEFNGYYPISTHDEDSSSSPSLPYTYAPSPITIHSYPVTSDSYAGLPTQSDWRGPLEAVTDTFASSATSQDPLHEFLTTKKRVLGSTAEDILGQIYERQSLKYENIRRITYESAHWGSQLRQLGDWRIGTFKDIDKTRSGLKKEIASLERERRMEEINCWRDITRLKSELRETLHDFNMEKRKEQFLVTSPN